MTMTPPGSHRECNHFRRESAQLALETRYRRLYEELLEILIELDPLDRLDCARTRSFQHRGSVARGARRR